MIGLGFAVEAVVHLVPDEAAAVPARLASLTAKQFVRPTVAEDDFYRFGHAVIKDAAYRSLLKRDRAELHERFVDWAEPVNRERGRELEFEEILGYHLEQAYRYRDRARAARRRRPSRSAVARPTSSPRPASGHSAGATRRRPPTSFVERAASCRPTTRGASSCCRTLPRRSPS